MKRETKKRMEQLLEMAERSRRNKDFSGIGIDNSRLDAAYYIEKRIALRKGEPEPVYDPYMSRRRKALEDLIRHEQERQKQELYSEAVELVFPETYRLTASPVLLLPG